MSTTHLLDWEHDRPMLLLSPKAGRDGLCLPPFLLYIQLSLALLSAMSLQSHFIFLLSSSRAALSKLPQASKLTI